MKVNVQYEQEKQAEIKQAANRNMHLVCVHNAKAYAEECYKDAEKAYKDQRYRDALNYASRAVAIDKENPLYQQCIANIYLVLGDEASSRCESLEASSYYRQALHWYQQANDPFSVGKLYHKLGKANPVYYLTS